ncbi:MAG: hypothetical protein IJA14_00965, partial [Alphaproteobacteria bacterium]|nr:hypothetical protein [Alphaproteobacteria bacterium]
YIYFYGLQEKAQKHIDNINQLLQGIEDRMYCLSISLKSRILKTVKIGERQSKLFEQQMLGFVVRYRQIGWFMSNLQFSYGDGWFAKGVHIAVGGRKTEHQSPFGNFEGNDIFSLYHESGHVKDLFKTDSFGTDETMSLISKLFFISSEEKVRAIDNIKRRIDLQKLKTELANCKVPSSIADFASSLRDIDNIDELANDISNRWLEDPIDYAKLGVTNAEEVFQIIGLRLIKGKDNKYYLVVNEESDSHFSIEQGLPIKMWHWGKHFEEFGKLLDILLSPSFIRVEALDALIRFYGSSMPEYLSRLQTSEIPLSFRNALFDFYGHNSPVGYVLRSQYSSLMSLLQNEYKLNSPLRTGNWPLVLWQPSFVLPHFSVLH